MVDATRQELAELQEAVAGLQRERTRWRLVGGLAVGLFVLVGAAQSQGVLDEVRTRRLALVDAQGGERAVLGIADGAPGLGFYDEQGKQSLLLVAGDHGRGLSVRDAQGTLRAGLALTSTDAPVLALYDAQGKVQAELSTTDAHEPVLALYDAQKTMRATLRVESDGSPVLGFLDAQGTRRASLQVVDVGPSFTLASATGVTVAILGATENESLLAFRDDQDRKVLWRMSCRNKRCKEAHE